MTRLNMFLVCSMLAAGFAVSISGCFAAGPINSATTCGDDAPDDGVACTRAVCDGDEWRQSRDDGLCDIGEMCDAEDGCVPRDPACPASCDDEVACTIDACVSGACTHEPDDGACPSGQVCDATRGCYTPPTMEECSTNADCNDGVSCTANRCVSGECRYIADNTTCPTGQVCDATRGCVDESDPPPTGFECAWIDGANRIGYSVRLCARGMTGVRTVPDNTGATRAMSAPSMRVWTLGPDVPADGCREYSLAGILGGVNTHPFIDQWRVDTTGGHPEWDRDITNVADFRPYEGRPAASVGLEAYVCQRAAGCSASQWIELPEAFYTIAPDTVGARFWSEDPNLHSSIRGTVAIRAVLETGCDAGRPPAGS